MNTERGTKREPKGTVGNPIATSLRADRLRQQIVPSGKNYFWFLGGKRSVPVPILLHVLIRLRGYLLFAEDAGHAVKLNGRPLESVNVLSIDRRLGTRYTASTCRYTRTED